MVDNSCTTGEIVYEVYYVIEVTLFMDLRYPSTLSFFAATMCDEEIWLSNLNYNGLYSYDMKKQKTTYIGKFPGHEKRVIGLHSMALKVDNKIIFAPFYSETIDFFDCKKGFGMCKIDSWTQKKDDNSFTCAVAMFEYAGYLYLIPRFANMPIIKYSINDNLIVEEIWLESIKENKKQDLLEMTVGVSRFETNIYISLLGTNVVVIYNMETNAEKILKLDKIRSIEGALYVDSELLAVNADRSMYFFNKELVCVWHDDNCVSEDEKLVIRIIRNENDIVAVPAWIGKIKIYDSYNLNKKREIEVNISDLVIKKGVVSNWRHAGTTLNVDRCVCINPVSLNKMVIIDLNDGSAKYLDCVANPNSMPPKNMRNRIYETESDDLQEYINFLVEEY